MNNFRGNEETNLGDLCEVVIINNFINGFTFSI